MKFALQLGYWGAQPPTNHADLVVAADKAGFDTVFTAEAWGSDAFTPLAWYGSLTEKIRLSTAVVQLSARTPTATAMSAMTLDHLSGGRFALGLGVSGPQVVEGWYGQSFAKPLARTREYIDIIRKVLRREEPVTSDGPAYALPYQGDDASGLGKPLKSIVHPLREDVPIWLGAEGPKNVALAAEIADGWLGFLASPRTAEEFNSWLDEGFARPGARRSREDFEVAFLCQLHITDDRRSVIDGYKPFTALYAGGMGAEEKNFHAEAFRRMGFGEDVDRITELFRAGRKDEAAAAVPDEMVEATAIIGDETSVREQIAEWEAAGITMLVVTARTVEQVEQIGRLIG
ncbi:LLM class F420-dependent oxidoreductase [Dietzia sp. B19]|uniref:LLM class F420-dependent oxidoreductase n=1 Tax=Dietzia sp. B19 TaxID=1630632 RepID=UPI0015F8A0DB|nr:LLM class F420-dependent oxidoreductase [Dietzia sp. B19]MBB1057146.1 LLM class F420-dependent oxidoreductase [Dietzia sp. B19]